ncbi:MAG: glycosyltransferase family A protein [Legionellaceae bacterium]|nr:glycosyltransferase family A protein [Legionellaceae bacterium]
MVNKPALVSIIIPTYNRADWLKVAIQSVLTQTYPYFELLILDNCSTDHTAEVVASFDDPRIKSLRHQCNIEPSANWSYGVSWASGEYLSILCDDDYYKPDFLSSRMDAFNKYENIQAVFSNYELCDEQGRMTSTSRACFAQEAVIHGQELLVCAVRNLWFIGATLFRRDIILKHWEDTQRAGNAADTSLKVRIALDPKNDVAWINNDGLVVRQHQNQAGRVRGKQVLFGHVAAFHEPLMFGNHTWSCKRLLKRGAARAYGTLRTLSWNAGDLRVACRCFLRQISAFPYLPFLHSMVCYMSRIKRHFT